MISPNAKKANDLHNQGIVEYKSGRVQEAILLLQKALELKPPLGLEVFIRKDLTWALFEPFKDMPEGTRLTPEQTTRFHEGEKCLSRLTQLCSGEAPEGPVTDINPRDLDEALKMSDSLMVYIRRTTEGWYIFPGAETPYRMYEFASNLGNEKDLGIKRDAADILYRALRLLDTSDTEQRKIASLAHARLANLLNALDDVDGVCKHAKLALSLGLPKDDLRYHMMIVLLRKYGRSWDENETKERKCFIATSVYGTENAPEVIELKCFRDEVLHDSKTGRFMVWMYYLVSPGVARVLNHSILLRHLVKCCFVQPIVRWWRSTCRSEAHDS